MFNPLGPWNAWFALSTQAARMCWDAQAVMLLRCLRVAQGGAKARGEAQRMITEKAAALVEAQVAATAACGERSTSDVGHITKMESECALSLGVGMRWRT